MAGTAAASCRLRPLDAGTQAPGLARLSRDDVDYAAQRFAAVEHGQWPAHDLDALDVVAGDPVVLKIAGADHAVARSDALPVDQE
jgi:KaiC/GvpD/RAD55 family RecA-like ATPase